LATRTTTGPVRASAGTTQTTWVGVTVATGQVTSPTSTPVVAVLVPRLRPRSVSCAPGATATGENPVSTGGTVTAKGSAVVTG
jgi:hypothetical protein